MAGWNVRTDDPTERPPAPLLHAFALNMPGEDRRLERTRMQFENVSGVELHRVEAQNHRQILTNPYFVDKMWMLSRVMSPKKTIGIAGTHILLAHSLLSSGFFRDETNRWALVVEDDVRVNDGATLLSEITHIQSVHPDADVIRLHCIFSCPRNSGGAMSGSAAAYLLSESGAQKLSETHITFMGHIDWAMNSKRFDIYNYNIMSTFDIPTPFKVNAVNDPGFWIQQPMMRVMGTDIKWSEFLVCVLVAGVVGVRHRAIRRYYFEFLTFLIAFIVINITYTSRYTMHYRTSDRRHILSVGLAVMILVCQSAQWWPVRDVYARLGVKYVTYSVLLWGMHYEEDRRLQQAAKRCGRP